MKANIKLIFTNLCSLYFRYKIQKIPSKIKAINEIIKKIFITIVTFCFWIELYIISNNIHINIEIIGSNKNVIIIIFNNFIIILIF